MKTIHILSEIVANKIAAGEVVERPASIVKELVENSIDADARHVDVLIQHGGKSFIRIADDGEGMSQEDLKLSVQRHATSKIKAADDLDRIATFGFRGEALPSIGAVSRMKIRTRLRGADQGYELNVSGGHVESVEPCSCREGTIIEIRDLFFNTPARRKFLKADGTERNHVSNVLANFAVGRTDLNFSLTSGDKKIWGFHQGETLSGRAAQSFGIARVEDLLKFSAEVEGIKIHGVIGKPTVARANRSSQIFFVNGRMVKSPALSFAVQDGFHGLLMHGQYPVVVVEVQVDPALVDVNVHPTKQEVRLSNERLLRACLKKAVAQRLSQEDDMAPFLQAPRGSEFKGSVSPSSWFRQAGERQAWDTGTDIPIFQAPSAEQVIVEPIALRNKLHITKILGQIHQLYIIAETEEGYMLIDQHAAHERVMFEELLKSFKSGDVKQQGLLLAETLELSVKHSEILAAHLPNLRKLGFDIECFGEQEYVIRAVPASMGAADPKANLQKFIEQQEAGKQVTDLESHPEELAALVACKRRSVKGGDSMTPQAMAALLERLASCEYPFSCPHGRPAFFRMTLGDLERQFKRKV